MQLGLAPSTLANHAQRAKNVRDLKFMIEGVFQLSNRLGAEDKGRTARVSAGRSDGTFLYELPHCEQNRACRPMSEPHCFVLCATTPQVAISSLFRDRHDRDLARHSRVIAVAER
jgi:hypothetical protein